MARRLQQTLFDYVVIAISPALIMTLVGSLVFFLLSVFYQGEFTARLHWVMACFVFAAVLIGRISIEEGLERAAPFGVALAIVVGIAANRFMEYQDSWVDQFSWAINWGLIALIWFCAHQLTIDCTLVDDAQDASGEGLLQVVGLDGPARPTADHAADKLLEGTTSRKPPPKGLWQRYLAYQRRPHAPGLWVVYFSLAALPLFGIGQWFIPETNVWARRYAFWLLGVYVASGLGLLLTTSFLGLRRYLRQRRIETPTAMANLWLGMGTALIALLLVVATLLPRPSAEYAISRLPFTLGSPKQDASNHAPVPREGTKSDQQGTAPDSQTNHEQPPGGSGADAPSNSKSQSNSPADGRQGNSSSDEAKGEPSASKQQSGNSGSKSSQDKSGSDQNQNQSPDKSADDQKSGDRPRDKQTPKSQSTDSRKSDFARAVEQLRQQQNPQPPSDQADEPQDANSPPDPTVEPPHPLDTALDAPSGPLVELLQWIFYIVAALATLWALWRFRAEIMAAFRDFLAAVRDLFGGWFGRKRVRAFGLDDTPPENPPAPFASFADPFATGIAGQYSSAELVRYSFEAFEAWSREHGCPRERDQTPHELAYRVAKFHPAIAVEARGLAELHAHAAYAGQELPSTTKPQLERLWQQMRAGTAVVG